MSKPVHIGCSGWNYREWRGVIYPEGLPARRWLERYAELFDTVEVNATFYRLPSENAVKTWAEQTPRRFVFAVKASRYLTHVKRLKTIGPGAKRFFDPLEPLAEGAQAGPRAVAASRELPARRRSPRGGARGVAGGRHCFEFRHPSWFTEEVYALLRRHRAALVIGDHPSARSRLTISPRTGPTSASTTAAADAAATTPSASWRVEAADRLLALRGRGLPLLQQRLGGLRPPRRPLARRAAFIRAEPPSSAADPRVHRAHLDDQAASSPNGPRLASYDPPGVGAEPLPEGERGFVHPGGDRGPWPRRARPSGWDRFFLLADSWAIPVAVSIAERRPGSILGIALGHAAVSISRHAERPTMVLRFTRPSPSSCTGTARHSFATASLNRRRDPSSEELAERMAAAVSGGAPDRPLVGGHRRGRAVRATSLRGLDLPFLLAKHEGCLMSTDERFEDALKALPHARRSPSPPRLDQ